MIISIHKSIESQGWILSRVIQCLRRITLSIVCPNLFLMSISNVWHENCIAIITCDSFFWIWKFLGNKNNFEVSSVWQRAPCVALVADSVKTYGKVAELSIQPACGEATAAVGGKWGHLYRARQPGFVISPMGPKSLQRLQTPWTCLSPFLSLFSLFNVMWWLYVWCWVIYVFEVLSWRKDWTYRSPLSNLGANPHIIYSQPSSIWGSSGSMNQAIKERVVLQCLLLKSIHV